MAELPGRININMEETNLKENWNSAGIFRYSWYDRGQLMGVNVDQYLPSTARRGYYPNPFGCNKAASGAWWMPLMEKAFAKFNTNYDNIQGGFTTESLRMFTNKPVFYFDHRKEQRDVEASWRKYHTLATRESPSVIGCCRKHPPGNLPTGHAYTLLATVEVSENGQTYRLVKIRNPWANERYSGPFSDQSSYWTPSLKK